MIKVTDVNGNRGHIQFSSLKCGNKNCFKMNNVFQVNDCCRACLRAESTLTPTTTMDNDSIKLCDKLFCCVAEVVS